MTIYYLTDKATSITKQCLDREVLFKFLKASELENYALVLARIPNHNAIVLDFSRENDDVRAKAIENSKLGYVYDALVNRTQDAVISVLNELEGQGAG